MRDLRPNREQMRDPALDHLVDVLREIHAAQTNGGAAPERPPAADPSSLASALGELLARGAGLYAPARAEPQAAAALYQALHEHVRQAEALTRAGHAAIDRLLGRAGNGATAPDLRPALVQETVYLQCARRGRTAGRFRCVNRADATVRARVRPGAVTAPGGRRVEGAAMTVSPRECTLGPGEPAIIRAGIDLRRCGGLAEDRIESSAEVEIDGACTLKVWLAIDLYDPTG